MRCQLSTGGREVGPLVLLVLVIMTQTATLSGNEQWPRINACMVMESPEDIPQGFSVAEPSFNEKGFVHNWLGARTNPNLPAGHFNQPLDYCQVTIWAANSPDQAWDYVGYKPWKMSVVWINGSYSGQPLGDRCMHSPGSGDPSANLTLTRGNVGLAVIFGSKTQGRKRWSKDAERLAKILVERTDYALRWGRAKKETISIGRRSMTVRNVPKVGYVGSATTLADRLGAKVSSKKKGGLLDRIILTRDKMTVELIAGHRESILRGKTRNLPFPSLVISRDDVVCLITPVAKALGTDIAS